jgi:hexosaminidase
VYVNANSMKSIGSKVIFFLAAASILVACSNGAQNSQPCLSTLNVGWKMLGTMENETSAAAFTFSNSGKSVVNNQNWALYFNQSTLRIHTMPDSLKGLVEHVNGDLYRFLPGKEFILNPGDSITINYSYKGFMIKESDAPSGAYFVYNLGHKDEVLVTPTSFVVAPFDNLQAIFPMPEIQNALPTAVNLFAKNEAIAPLSGKQLGKIIPTPMKWVELSGKVKIDDATVIAYAAGLENEAQFLSQSVKKLFNITLVASQGAATSKNVIELKQGVVAAGGVSAEAYKLSINQNSGIQITGSDAAGVFYGAQSLLSVLWADKDSTGVFAECAEITDAPRFGYRGFLLDVSRNFQQKKDVLRLIELLACYKVNKLNIRITEDEGWRIEINGLPELTQVGSKRGHAQDSKNWLTPSFGSGPNPDSENNYGKGYYTREDFKEILKHAQKHHVQVIPEVCLPSHARAAIKAMEVRYDFYMAKNEPENANEFRLIDPTDKSEYLSAQMYKDNIVNVALPSVYHFYETVIKDFMAMYEEAGMKMTVFNTGGDEVPNGAWAKSPLSLELMKSLPEIKDVRQLQGYFLEKAMAIFEKYNLQVTGWEEIVLNKDSADNVSVNSKFVGKNILPLVWDNTGDNVDLGYRIANAGYPVVLCNVSNLYFDLAYNLDPKEPGLYWGGFQDALDAYVMAPYDVYKTTNFDFFGRLNAEGESFEGKVSLAPDKRKNIVGLSAQLWSETIKGAGMMEYYVVPKIFAFAEKAWAQAPAWESESNITNRNKAILAGWNVLANRIGQYEYSKIDAWFGDYNYRIASPGAIVKDGMLHMNTEFPGLILRYTTNGTETTTSSPIYTSPVGVTGVVKVRAFNQKGRGSRVIEVK